MSMRKGQTNSGSFQKGNDPKRKPLTREQNIKGGKNRVKQIREKGQFKQLMDGIIARNGSSAEDKKRLAEEKEFPTGTRYNYKLLEQEPNKVKKLLKDYLNDKLDEIASNNKTHKYNIIVRLVNILLDPDTNNKDFMSALDQARDIIGEKETDKTIIIKEDSEIPIDKLKEMKELLNNK